MEHLKTPTEMSLEQMTYTELNDYCKMLENKLEKKEYPDRNKDCVEFLTAIEIRHEREKKLGKCVTGMVMPSVF